MPRVTATKAKVPDVKEVADDLNAIIRELSGQFYERQDVLTGMILCLLAGQHGFLLGPPGSAKSEMCNAIAQRIRGAKYWHILFDRQMSKEEVFGQIDMALYDKTGQWQSDITDTLADCTVGFGDEIGKASSSVLNTTLTALNERKYKHGKSWIDIPLMTFFAASNEMLESELAATFDRFVWRRVVEYIIEPTNKAAYLQSKVRRATNAPTTYTVVDQDKLRLAVNDVVPTIRIPQSVEDALIGLWIRLKSEHDIEVSDRRLGQCIRFMQASAFLGGRDVVDDDDVIVLKDLLWTIPAQIKPVEQLVLESASELTKAAMEIDRELDDLSIEIKNRANDDVPARAEKGAEVTVQLTRLNRSLHDLYDRASQEGRSTLRIDTVMQKHKAVRAECFIVLQNMKPETARQKVGL